MDKYQLTLNAINLIDGVQSRYVTIDLKTKGPLIPAKDWQLHGNQLSATEAAEYANKWGFNIAGVAATMRDDLVTFDFDPIEKTIERDPEFYESRKGWRERFEEKLQLYTYAEKSRSGRGSHYIVRVPQGFTGRRGIELSKKFYAIDVLTGARYCDITGYRINSLPVADDSGLVSWYLSQMEDKHIDADSTTGITYEHGTFPIACLEELLDYVKIDLEDYSGWLEIGLALFNETHGSNAGLQLWINWSQKYGGEKYNPHNITYKWGTFKLNKYKYSVGSIIRHAKAGGANIAQIRLRHKTWSEVAGLRTMKVGS